MSEQQEWYFRYKVTDVWGSMVGRLGYGEVIVDTEHGDEHEYTIMNENTGKIIGGCHVERIGAVTDPEALAAIQGLTG